MSEDKLSSATVEPTKGAENTAGAMVTLPRQDVEIMLTCTHQVKNRADGKFHQKLDLLITRVMANLTTGGDGAAGRRLETAVNAIYRAVECDAAPINVIAALREISNDDDRWIHLKPELLIDLFEARAASLAPAVSPDQRED